MTDVLISTEQLEDTLRALRQCDDDLRTLYKQAHAEAKSSRAYYARASQWASALEADAQPSQPQTVVPGAVEMVAGQLEQALLQCLQERAHTYAAERHRLEVLHEYQLSQLIKNAPREEPPTEQDERELAEIDALEDEERNLQELKVDLAERVRSLQRRHENAERHRARKETETAVMQAYVVDRPSEVLDYAKYLFGQN